MFGGKNLLDDFFKKRLLVRDLKLFSNGMNCFLCPELKKKKEALELIMDIELRTAVGASDSCICPDCSDLLPWPQAHVGSQHYFRSLLGWEVAQMPFCPDLSWSVYHLLEQGFSTCGSQPFQGITSEHRENTDVYIAMQQWQNTIMKWQ